MPEGFNQHRMKILEFDGIDRYVSFDARALDPTSRCGSLAKTENRKRIGVQALVQGERTTRVIEKRTGDATEVLGDLVDPIEIGR